MSALRRYLVLLGVLVLLALTACTNQVGEPARQTEISDPITPAQVQPVESTREGNLEGIISPSATAERFPTNPTKYDLDVELDYDAKTLAVAQIITYTNSIDRNIEKLPILIPPADREGVFILRSIEIEPAERVVEVKQEQSRLDLMMDPPMTPGEQLNIHINYLLRLPMNDDALGYTDRQVLLTDWYPLIPPFQVELGWIINPPGLVGEYLAYPLNDYHLNLCLVPHRDDLVVAASAPVTETNNGCYQYDPQDKRNISLGISPHYQLATATSDLVTVTAYTFPEHGPLGQRAAKLAIKAWSAFTDLYGTNERDYLAIVEADIFDGLETDGLIYLSEWYYQTADPTPQNYFELLIVHETAHQWFYGFIHNDQANEPWLDEALATYSEVLYLELHHPELVNWWWEYRVNTYAPEGPVNADIYTFNHYRPYINAVYLQGASFLKALRAEIGDAAFYQGLQQYLQSNHSLDNLRTSVDFFNNLSQVSDADITEIIAEFFQ